MMLGMLPDLTPRDSHSIWYTSSRNPHRNPVADHHGGAEWSARHQSLQEGNGNGNQIQNRRPGGQQLLERSHLAKLRTDEQYSDLRRNQIQNFGAAWLKPPGIPKTLLQMREEQREAAEHAEALRREQMQAELADAGANGFGEGTEDVEGMGMLEDDGTGAGGEGGPGGEGMPSGGALDDMGDGARDLDEDIPDADEMGLGGFQTESSDEDDLDSDSASEGASAAPGANDTTTGDPNDNEESREERREELVQARMRMADDAFRQALARGDADAGDLYPAEEELEAEDEGHMFLEEDVSRRHRGGVVPGERGGYGVAGDPNVLVEQDDLDMDADLDGSIPEAGEMSGVYEHTDTEAELSSISSSSSNIRGGAGQESESGEEEDDFGASFAPRSSVAGMMGGGELRPPTSPTLMARDRPARGHQDARRSVDLSSLLSAGGSSPLGKDPSRQ